jgi:Protein of unknown function (DUF1592)/Protein of unknown function (DUF1588)/Protein of unknown function (DUF1587)/Protein of unknown function (DUF1585)/Ca-dependent carbohydrate-binding module xylan-binding/Protein of unknown function (DUF1595)/Planctomycete cytochrome C
MLAHMLAALLISLSLQEPAPTSDFEQDVSAYLEAHCIECHAGSKAKAGLDLSQALDEHGARSDDEIDWAYLRERVDDGEMPPRARPDPAAQSTDRFLSWISAAHGFEPRGSLPIDPGRPVLRRLNRREYRNTVRDILGVDVPVQELFPADAVGHGFDHIGESLTLSDALFEKYLEAAERTAGEAWLAFAPEDVETRRYLSDQIDAPDRGGFVILTTNGLAEATHSFQHSGRYRLRVGAFGQQAGPDPCRMALVIDGRQIEAFDVPQKFGDEGLFEAEVQVDAGNHPVGGAFLNDYYKPDAEIPAERDRNLVIAWVEVHGPLEAPMPSVLQAELSAAFPESLGERRLRNLLAHLTGLLWRRPATGPELHRIESALDSEQSFDRSVQDALVMLLVSPNFLFRFERDHDAPQLRQQAASLAEAHDLIDEAVALDGYELATRLSYFLWSTAPDEELRQLAENGELLGDEALHAQTSRMLGDPRSWSFTESFAGQWLQLRKLELTPIDTEAFPDFDDQLRSSMVEETLRVFHAILHEKRDLRELLDADFTFLDDRLALHYGLDEFETLEGDWMRASLAAERRGVVAHASILTLTSESTRTSPVKRGKWLLETLLNEPPPPPPVDAGSFDGDGVGASAASLREELALHRARVECASCHDAMDPLGLALENFGPTGAWRDEDQGQAIDASGQFPDGRTIEGLDGLRRELRDDPAFLRAVLTKLYIYALGRPAERSDRAQLTSLVAALDPEKPTLWDAIHDLVQSPAFRLRRGSE